MLILAVDTSGSNCSVALMKDNVLLGEYNMNFGKQHSVLLMPMIEDLMKKTEISTGDLTHLALNLGPGSFTGLRIGLSVIEAMSYALSIPLYGYTSFETTAESLKSADRRILVLHDALKKTFYSAAFSNEASIQVEVLEPEVRSLSELKDLFGSGQNLVLAGDALGKYLPDLKKTFPDARFSPDSVIQRASSAARLCYADVQLGVSARPTILPRYMRKPQAEREYEAKHGHDINS